MRQPKPHFYRFPTAGLFADYRNLPATELNVFRAARAYLAFADMGVMRLGGLLGAWPMLPVNLVLEVLPAWNRHSRIAADTFGTSARDQLRQCVRLALNDGPSPMAYYLAGIASHEDEAELATYIHDQFHETLIEFCRFAVERLHGVQQDLNDKLSFEENCRKFDLPCIETFLKIAADGNVAQVSADAMECAKLASSLFVKPVLASQGRGTERWDKRDAGYVEANGASVPDFAALLRHLKSRAMAQSDGLLVQEAAVNAPEIETLGGRALSTVRLVTLRTPDGAVRPIQVGMRVAGRAAAVADNYHAGGAYFFVDHLTGEIGRGISLDFPEHSQYLTGAPGSDHRLTGNTVEGWEQLKDLALRLHEKLTIHAIGGWDVALTDRGPVAVECNSVPGLPAAWQRLASGFLGTEYSKMLCSEILTYLHQLAPAGSRFRFGGRA
ncbi:MAG: sugar-transfer associated ATP-grasp domain-containing protein [Pseudomonadota bacterium]